MISIYCGKVEDLLSNFRCDFFDACLCDPPYGLKFMGKSWDHGVPSAAIWKLVKRTLKPGAPILAFGGTRTYHRLACAIEDAGFEIFDSILGATWIYGQGFPKSLDISKAIDKAAGVEREKTGTRIYGDGHIQRSSLDKLAPPIGTFKRTQDLRATSAPATDHAQIWDGYGTALKPAWEPIVFARKPLSGTYADNCIEYGCGGLNIEGCRIGTDDSLNGGAYSKGNKRKEDASAYYTGTDAGQFVQPSGRYPANLILSHHPECEDAGGCHPECPTAALDRQSIAGGMHGAGHARKGSPDPKPTQYQGFRGTKHMRMQDDTSAMHRFGDSGGASRFFQQSAWAPDELLFHRAESILASWNPDLASIVGIDLSQRSLRVASALSLAVTVASRGEIHASDWTGLSTIATKNELRNLCVNVIAATLSLGVEQLPVRLHVEHTPTRTLVNSAGISGQTDTTTTIPNQQTSDGCVAAATFASTQPTTDHGEAVFRHDKMFYCAKVSTSERNRGLPAGVVCDHPTLKPIDLCRYLATLILPPLRSTNQPRNLLVPFSGAGSEIIGAALAGWESITAIEKEDNYIEQACYRIKGQTGIEAALW